MQLFVTNRSEEINFVVLVRRRCTARCLNENCVKLIIVWRNLHKNKSRLLKIFKILEAHPNDCNFYLNGVVPVKRGKKHLAFRKNPLIFMPPTSFLFLASDECQLLVVHFHESLLPWLFKEILSHTRVTFIQYLKTTMKCQCENSIKGKVNETFDVDSLMTVFHVSFSIKSEFIFHFAQDCMLILGALHDSPLTYRCSTWA